MAGVGVEAGEGGEAHGLEGVDSFEEAVEVFAVGRESRSVVADVDFDEDLEGKSGGFFEGVSSLEL